MDQTKYVVWRRNDGYVGCTTHMPQDYQTGGAEPTDPRSRLRPGSGEPVLFAKLDEFNEWQPAHDLVARMRAGTPWEAL